MAATENYRVSTCLAALEAAIGRIELQAKNEGSLKEIARECASVQDFLLAVNRADSDSEIEELVSVRNS